ncbi:transposase [Plakobranchus ocellatus]|uniref:Transposase n=1 Tax=Plakobranchus ocellatus TaxID=259542 RepID=A0AAV3ZEM0_9GAST|nr:transposase [Plakobranchus ocellatus]
MILFKDSSCLKQYCPVKPIKRGFFKMRVQTDMGGYIGKFEIYQGKGTGAGNGYGLGESAVINLREGILNKGHKIFFDNFFHICSPSCLTHLADNNTWACGTVRPNRSAELRDILLQPNPGQRASGELMSVSDNNTSDPGSEEDDKDD